MSKGPRGEKRPGGTVECAHEVFQIAIGEKQDELPSGRIRSGKAGGKARAKALTSDKRSEIAKKAASARWD